MRIVKWLYPGMGVKRWLALLILGVLIISRGLAVLLPGCPGDLPVLGSLLIVLGALCLVLAIRFGIRSVVSAIRPADVSDLVEHVYKQRNLQKGPRIVAIGGGTGLSTMLRGLKAYSSNITAIVTVADDGGSSGRIRQELGILPPGDLRSVVVALADTEPLMESLFQYRFSWGDGLKGHNFGNLFIAALTDITGDFEESIRAFSKVLAVRGRVLPSTLQPIRLGAIYEDGSRLIGESDIPRRGKRIKRVFLDPPNAKALPEALQCISQADLVVLGPGSLYTSVIPNLLIEGIADALSAASALRVYVCNVMTQPGETDGLSASGHLKAVLAHADGKRLVDYVLINQSRISGELAKKYAEQGAYPVRADLGALKGLGVEIRAGDFLDQLDLVRHDSEKLAAEIMLLAKAQGKFWGNGDLTG